MRNQSIKSSIEDINKLINRLAQQEENAAEIAALLPDAFMQYEQLKRSMHFIRLRRNLFLKRYPNHLQADYALALQKKLDEAEAKIKALNIQKSFALTCQFLAAENEFDDETYRDIEKLKSACAMMKKRAELSAIGRHQKITLLSTLSSHALRVLRAELDQLKSMILAEKKSGVEKQLHEIEQVRSEIAATMFDKLMRAKKKLDAQSSILQTDIDHLSNRDISDYFSFIEMHGSPALRTQLSANVGSSAAFLSLQIQPVLTALDQYVNPSATKLLESPKFCMTNHNN